MIWREVVRVRAAGKPVVVSMGDVAASGGYFISAPADVIVAQPATITGSIGVIIGKPVLQDLFERVGVATDSARRDGAANATMFSSARPFTEADWSRINEWLDAVYADFTEKVASGRRMDIGRVHELARGRVWTGADAVANGLADQTGGMREAIAIARQRAGLPDDAPARSYPRFGPLDQLRPAESSEARPAAAGQLGAGARRGAVRRRLGSRPGGSRRRRACRRTDRSPCPGYGKSADLERTLDDSPRQRLLLRALGLGGGRDPGHDRGFRRRHRRRPSAGSRPSRSTRRWCWCRSSRAPTRPRC